MAVYEAIRNLVQYGVNTGLLQESDRIYATNQILEVLGLDEYEEPQGACREISLEETLDALLDYAHETGVLKEDGVVYRDLFDTKLMNCLMPRPSEVIGHFWKLYEESPGGGNQLLLQIEPGFQLHPPLPCFQGYEMENGYKIRGAGHHG